MSARFGMALCLRGGWSGYAFSMMNELPPGRSEDWLAVDGVESPPPQLLPCGSSWPRISVVTPWYR
jgi:hypothetical protein